MTPGIVNIPAEKQTKIGYGNICRGIKCQFVDMFSLPQKPRSLILPRQVRTVTFEC